jgi:D-alanyl-D-alanine carboxypeptidase (penicillin-binding protein 5/6)
MKLLKHTFLLFTLFNLFIITAYAAPKIIPKAPAVAANSYVLMDHGSGRIISMKDADTPVAPASITKVMTAYVVFSELQEGNIKLEDMVTISEKAWRTPGSRMFIKVNTQVSVEDLLQGMIIQSGNDASVALAEFVAGSEETFAALMNQHARELGMKNTHFVNSTGLPDPQHLTTAHDLAILASTLISRFPQYYHWYSTKEFTYNNITQPNRNKLLWRDKSVDGMKTGYTDDAGYCLLSSAMRDEMRLISVVLGTKSENARAQESQKLLNFGFRFYQSHALYKADKALKKVRIYKGEKEQLAVGVSRDMYVIVPRGQYKKLKPSININRLIEAPVTKGQHLGQVEIRLEDKVIAKAAVIALENIAEGSLWHQAIDSAIMLYEEKTGT